MAERPSAGTVALGRRRARAPRRRPDQREHDAQSSACSVVARAVQRRAEGCRAPRPPPPAPPTSKASNASSCAPAPSAAAAADHERDRNRPTTHPARVRRPARLLRYPHAEPVRRSANARCFGDLARPRELPARQPGGKRIYVDPWLGNPKCPDAEKEPERIDVIALTHGHGDHVGETVELSKQF